VLSVVGRVAATARRALAASSALQSDQIVVQHAEVSLVSQLGRELHSSIIQRLLFATGLVKALSAALTLRRSAWKTRAYQKENRSSRGLLLRQPSAIAAKKSSLYNTR
jgi:hypothetical protein